MRARWPQLVDHDQPDDHADPGRRSRSRCAGRRRWTPRARRRGRRRHDRGRRRGPGRRRRSAADDALPRSTRSTRPQPAPPRRRTPAGPPTRSPTCFTCGPDREEGDGLRIFPGPVDDLDGAGPRPVAAAWTPHPSIAEDWHTYDDDHRRASLPVTWAALDCLGGWAGDLADRPMVLGRMTARVDALPVIGEEHVVVGHFRGREGRKTFTAATLYDSDGRVVATAEHIWITVDPAAFR